MKSNFSSSPRGNFGRKPFGGKPSFGGDRGGRPSFGDRKPFGDRPSFGDRPRPSFNRDGGDRPSFGSRPPFKKFGDRPSFGGDRGARPSFGDRPSFNRHGGDRPSFGSRPPFKKFGDRPSFGGDRGGRPSFGDRKPFGDRSSFGDRPRPSFNRDGGDRPSFGSRPPFKKFGDRPSFGGDRDGRPSFGDKPRYNREDRPAYQRDERPQYEDRKPRVETEDMSYGAKMNRDVNNAEDFEVKPKVASPHDEAAREATAAAEKSDDIIDGKRGPRAPWKPPVVHMREPSVQGAQATTSWGEVAEWYDKHLEENEDTYHSQVILPNLKRLVDPQPNQHILEIACGQGFFARRLAASEATIEGIDIGEDLIKIAKKRAPEMKFSVGNAEDLSAYKDASFDTVYIVLAIQNIERVPMMLAEVSRVLKQGGSFHVVMNHPAFRIPRETSWEYVDDKGVQARRVDAYLSESKTAMEMHPGMTHSPQTISFHRPLQYYVKHFAKAGMLMERFEEWISHKVSDSGPRAEAENKARKEFPMFLYMSAKKC